MLDERWLPPLLLRGSSDAELRALPPPPLLDGPRGFNNASERCALQRLLRGALVRPFGGSALAEAPRALREAARFLACSWRTAENGGVQQPLLRGVAHVALCSQIGPAARAHGAGSAAGARKSPTGAAAAEVGSRLFQDLILHAQAHSS